MSRNGSTMAEAGSVSWMFEKKGYILIDKNTIDEDTIMTIALEAEAEDFKNDLNEDNYEIITDIDNFDTVKKAIERQGIEIVMAEITMLPKSYINLEGKEAQQMIKLYEALEDQDDIQNVYINCDLPDEVSLN
jgi:transcriptional/translational regulatory protein YebC/TACO1